MLTNETEIKKAVFPVAVMGARFLPAATKAFPKELLPVVDKPLIQYAVEEAVTAGICNLIFVTFWTKRSIEDHFDKNFELEYKLEALGLGHAVLCAREIVGNEPFAMLLADDMIYCDQQPCLNTMVDLASESNSSVVAVEQVPMERVNKYGVIDPVKISDRLHKLQGVVEKPPIEKAPSNLSIVGRYVLQPRIFELLESTGRGAGNEIQLTDAIAALLQEQNVLAYEFDGIRYDCGSKLGHMKANIEYALRHPELNGKFKVYLQHIMKFDSDNKLQ